MITDVFFASIANIAGLERSAYQRLPIEARGASFQVLVNIYNEFRAVYASLYRTEVIRLMEINGCENNYAYIDTAKFGQPFISVSSVKFNLPNLSIPFTGVDLGSFLALATVSNLVSYPAYWAWDGETQRILIYPPAISNVTGFIVCGRLVPPEVIMVQDPDTQAISFLPEEINDTGSPVFFSALRYRIAQEYMVRMGVPISDELKSQLNEMQRRLINTRQTSIKVSASPTQLSVGDGTVMTALPVPEFALASQNMTKTYK